MSEAHYNEYWKAVPGERAAKSFGSINGLYLQGCRIDGDMSEWGLKVSNSTDVNVVGCYLKNGFDRAFDMVRGADVHVDDCHFSITNGSRKKFGWLRLFSKECDIGLKGGIQGGLIENSAVDSILIGDYSLYDQAKKFPPTRNIEVRNCRNPYGGKVTVRVWHGENVKVDDTCRLIVFPKWLTWIYFTVRKWIDKTPIPPA